ncbi:hypothetical protein CEXT_138351 [Caerostris extrusa]|uniref:Uncharacterized protein n=1 Tax=Caerostris extrusa TaxID=172846 RepID=A0AAV4VPJ0_CAEEX|nr:hypothetical protein CEXT_138351 [Caerostris extrusa]
MKRIRIAIFNSFKQFLKNEHISLNHVLDIDYPPDPRSVLILRLLKSQGASRNPHRKTRKILQHHPHHKSYRGVSGRISIQAASPRTWGTESETENASFLSSLWQQFVRPHKERGSTMGVSNIENQMDYCVACQRGLQDSEGAFFFFFFPRALAAPFPGKRKKRTMNGT